MDDKWSYKITKSHDDLWYVVYRISWDEKFCKVEWLWKTWWVLNRNNAIIFVTQDEALSNLVIARHKWDAIGFTSPQKKKWYEKKSEKTSWSDF